MSRSLKSRSKAEGDTEGVQKKVWRAVRAAEEIMYDKGTSAHQTLKAVTAAQQATRTYVKLVGTWSWGSAFAAWSTRLSAFTVTRLRPMERRTNTRKTKLDV